MTDLSRQTPVRVISGKHRHRTGSVANGPSAEGLYTIALTEVPHPSGFGPPLKRRIAESFTRGQLEILPQ
ncbi:hypothetical protein [Hymenobacter sp. BT491]|uniref:hypothetical protein n=1 Tax=Hymenobacter sp. BT491 TaxID=2766779 RepID=UPI001653A66F|nr:hypothetical protein [Hymenobacter sp. BT491]MBC6988974.1 hypothetical protein [Hymenobacter sp. BT491]